MDSKEREDFLKSPRLDILNRHKKRRVEIAKRLAAAGDQGAVEALAAVASDSEDDSEVRHAAVKALGAIHNKRSVRTLAALLNDKAENELHSIVINSLANLGTYEAIKTLIGAWEPVKGLKREAIRRALLQLERGQTREPLVEALTHPSPTVREQAKLTLQQFEDLNATLVMALGHNTSDAREGVRALLVQQGASAVPHLVAVLGDTDDVARAGAIETLAQMGKPAVEELVSVTVGNDARAAEAAAQALVEIGRSAVRPLIRVADYPRAAETLEKMQDVARSVLEESTVDDIPLLVTALSSAADELCRIAAERLAEIGAPAVPPVMKWLTGEDKERSMVAKEILIEMGADAVPFLLENADDGELKPQIKDLLVEIGKPALPLLYHRLWNLEEPNAEEFIRMMCAIASTDRLSLAIDIYHRRISALLRWIGTESNMLKLDGDRSEEQRHAVDAGPFKKLKVVQEQVELELHALATFAPELAPPRYWLGQWYLVEQQEGEKAVQCFEEAINCAEQLYEYRQAKSYWWLGVYYTVSPAHHDYEKAMTCFEKSRELGWYDVPLIASMVRVLDKSITDSLTNKQDGDVYLRYLNRKVKVLEDAHERFQKEDEIVKDLEESRKLRDEAAAEYEELGAEVAFAKIRADWIVDKAEALSDDDHDQEAVDLLNELLKDQPEHEDANELLARCYFYLGRVRKGFQQVQKYLELRTDHVGDLSFYLSRLPLLSMVTLWQPMIDQELDSLIARQHFGEAMKLLSEWETLFFPRELPENEVRRQPVGILTRFGAMLNNIGARYGKVAQASDRLKAYTKSLTSLQRASAHFGDSTSLQNLPIAHRNLAVYYRERGEPMLAIEHLQKAVDINPQYADGWWELSLAFLEINEIETSMECLMRAGQLGDPDALAMIRQLRGG